jgi:hypothetical protein
VQWLFVHHRDWRRRRQRRDDELQRRVIRHGWLRGKLGNQRKRRLVGSEQWQRDIVGSQQHGQQHRKQRWKQHREQWRQQHRKQRRRKHREQRR